MELTIALCAAAIALLTVLGIISRRVTRKRKNLRTAAAEIANSCLQMTADEFFDFYKKRVVPDFEGVYIIYNRSLEKAYVRGSKTVIEDAYRQLSGGGSKQVYDDSLLDDRIIVKLIDIGKSGHKSLELLEKHMRMSYDRHYNYKKG